MRKGLLVIVLAALMAGPGVTLFAAEAPEKTPAMAEETEAPPAKANPVAEYFIDRGKDFLDIFSIRLGMGDGKSVLLHVRPTRLLQLGAGRFVGTKIGFEGPSAGTWGEGRLEGGISVFYWSWIGRKTSEANLTESAVKTNRFFGKVEDILATGTYREFYDANKPWYTIGGSFALPFLPTVEAELNPAEAIDFLVSFFAIPHVRVPPPFFKHKVNGELIPYPTSNRWHGQTQYEKYD